MNDIARRPTLRDQVIIDAVATKLVDVMTIRGGVDKATAIKHVGEAIFTMRHADGYQMTRLLEVRYGWRNCTMNIAEALNGALDLLYAEVRAKTEEWVSQYGIKPKNKVGDQVCVNLAQQYTGEVVKVFPGEAQYLVMVPELGHVRHGQGTQGLLVNYEDIHAIAATPEEFELAAQG